MTEGVTTRWHAGRYGRTLTLWLVLVVGACMPMQSAAPPPPPWVLGPARDPANNPAAFATYVRSLAWNAASGGDVQRECANCPAGARTRVQIQAVPGGRDFTPGPVAVIGRLINRGSQYTEARYQLAPGGTYYFVVGPPDAQNYVPWRLWRVQGNSATATDVTGWYWRCHHDKTDHRGYRAGRTAQFLSCDVRGLVPAGRPGGGEPEESALTELNGDGWYECDSGSCCNSGSTRLTW